MICTVIADVKTRVEIAEWTKYTAHEQLAVYGTRVPHATTIARVVQRLDISAFVDGIIRSLYQLYPGREAGKHPNSPCGVFVLFVQRACSSHRKKNNLSFTDFFIPVAKLLIRFEKIDIALRPATRKD